jgi:hypothetical protein
LSDYGNSNTEIAEYKKETGADFERQIPPDLRSV